jgi:hypothetical protein
LALNMGTCVWAGWVTRHSNKILDSTRVALNDPHEGEYQASYKSSTGAPA